MSEYTGPERRTLPISEALLEEIVARAADKAADKAVERLTEQAYAAVGRGVIQRFFTIIGILSVGFYAWAKQHGWIE